MKTPLIVVIPYHSGDIELTRQLLRWIVDLGNCKPYSLLLAADSGVPRETMQDIADIARPVFESVKTMIVQVGQSAWPPNVMFLSVARQIETSYRTAFFWMEPDCIPLCKGWLETLASEYANCPKQFMGPLVDQNTDNMLPSRHLTGCSIYPNHAYSLVKDLKDVLLGKSAWDIGAAGVEVSRANNTDLIHHHWGGKDTPPVFVDAVAPGSPKNHVGLGFIKTNAVLFHRSKDGGLIKLLRAKVGIPAPKEEMETATPPATPTPPIEELGERTPTPAAPPAAKTIPVQQPVKTGAAART